MGVGVDLDVDVREERVDQVSGRRWGRVSIIVSAAAAVTVGRVTRAAVLMRALHVQGVCVVTVGAHMDCDCAEWAGCPALIMFRESITSRSSCITV